MLLLRLRKILLCDILYYIIFIIVVIITLLRLFIVSDNYKSPYIGIVTKIVKISDKTTIYLDNKVIGNVYKNIDVALGDKVKVYGEEIGTLVHN